MVEGPSSHFSEALKTQLIFSRVSSCLPYKDLFSLMRTCKFYTQMGNLHLRMLLKQLNFSEELEKNSQIQDFSYFLRYFYYRELLTAQIPIPFENDLKVIRNNKLGFKGIQEFSIGIKISGFHLYNKDLIVMETEKLYDISNDKPEHLTIKGVKKFSTNAKNFVFLTEKAELITLIYEENVKLANMKMVKLNVFFPIVDIAVSYHNIIMISPNNEDISLKCLESPENEWMKTYIKSNKSQFNIFILAFADLLSEENYQEPLKILKMVDAEPFKKEIKSFCLGQHFAYFVNENCNLLQVDLHNFNKELIVAISTHPFFLEKPIEKVFSGLFYYLALEREEMKSIDTWDNTQILKWAEEIGFEDYIQILKYENIVGAQLANVNKSFLLDTLGMTKIDLQNKFLTEIHNNLKTRFKTQILYGWGNNNSGQLGLPPCNNISTPVKIPLPQFAASEDEIEKFECGWKMSCFLTKKHKLFISEISEKKQYEKIEMKPEEEKISHSKKAKKEEKKPSHPPPSEKKDKPRWINISSYFEKLKDKRTYIIANLSVGKDNISVLGGYTGISKQIEVYHEEDYEKKSKFRTAEYIINRIQWDPNLNLKEYRIGYEDRFLGIVEIEFDEFIAKAAEIKEHRIKYFKKTGEVVWDKNLKIDKF